VPDDAWRQEYIDLLDDHGETLMAMLRRLCGNAHDAEDAFQDAAVRVWRTLASRPKLRNPRAWLMTVGYRAFLDSRKRRKAHAELPDAVDGRNASPERQAERSEERDHVQAAIAELPEATREVVILHYVAGLSLSQTAAAMDIAEGTAKSRLNAAINKLRSILE
jgi:RNA polymerase sigma-70 factor, ECF subfamily